MRLKVPPSRRVRLLKLTLTELSTSNSRSLWFPLMTVAPGPAPTMATGPVTSKSPAAFVSSSPASVWVNTPAPSTIVSAPGLALARVMASRSDTRPSIGLTTSAPVVTVNVAGTSRPSSGSTPRRLGRRLAGPDFVGREDQNRADMTRLLTGMLVGARETAVAIPT